MKKRFTIVTAIAFVLWVTIAGTIMSGVISVRDIDMFNRMGSAPAGGTDG